MNKIFVKKKKGMTLIEVVVSLAIFAIIVIPLGLLVTTSVKTNKKSENVQQYSLNSQKIIEAIKAQHNVNADNTISLNLTDNVQYMTQMTTTTDSTKYNLGYSISNADIGLGDNVKADITYQRKNDISYAQNQATNISYDAVINLTSGTTFDLRSSAIVGSYTSKGSIEIASDDSSIKINNSSDGTNIVTLSSITSAVKKIKIITSTAGDITLFANNASTSSDKILSLYTYKKDSSSGNINCSAESNNIRVYQNLQEVSSTDANNGIYDINIKLYSISGGVRNKVYEISSSINIFN